MVGIVAGCWSSVCIAGPLWHLLRTRIASKKDSTPSAGSSDSTKGGSSGNSSSKKKKGSSNLSKKERKLQRQKEIEEKNKAKITV